jgi:hypothetical protein
MSKEIDKVLDAIKDLKEHIGQRQTSLEDRISQLEKWRWIILGVLIAAGAVLPEIRAFIMSSIS